jgi:hypothetical protein
MSSEPKADYRTVDGLQIRYADSGGPASQHVVLTSPWPESLRAFDRMWPRLSGIARLLAIDLPGFGQSERRADLLTPAAMSDFLIGVLDAASGRVGSACRRAPSVYACANLAETHGGEKGDRVEIATVFVIVSPAP